MTATETAERAGRIIGFEDVTCAATTYADQTCARLAAAAEILSKNTIEKATRAHQDRTDITPQKGINAPNMRPRPSLSLGSTGNYSLTGGQEVAGSSPVTPTST